MDTPVVVTVNVAVVAPAAIVTDAWTVAEVLLDERETTSPPVGAGPLSVAVPVDEVPPVTVVGESVMLVKVGALMVNVADWLMPASVPVIVEVVLVTTAVVVTVNVVEVAPAGTVTVAGTVALVEELVRLTDAPPGPAAPERVAVPVELEPPVTVAGFRLTLLSVAGVMVSVAVLLVPLCVAVIVADVLVDTAVVDTVKVAVDEFAGTVTLD